MGSMASVPSVPWATKHTNDTRIHSHTQHTFVSSRFLLHSMSSRVVIKGYDEVFGPGITIQLERDITIKISMIKTVDVW